MIKKRKFNASLFMSNKFLLVALLVAILFAVGFARVYVKNYSSIKEIEQLEQEAKRLETEKVSLLGLLDYVQSDAYVEEEARKNLQYKKPGEEVVVFKDPQSTAENKTSDEYKSNLVLWWEYFFAPNS